MYNIFMINITQNKLKYIFSNNNILLDSLKFCKKNNIGDSHLEHIKLSFDKFLACRDISKGFVKFKCPHCPVTHLFPITCKSKLCPSCGYKYSRTWTENIQKHILNIEHRHVLLLSLKNAESSSFTTDLFCQNFLPLLTRYSSSSFTISAGKEKEKTKFLDIPDITLLTPILYITASFLSFILLAGT
ncbi:transposase zinc-binding domain-containing protein [Leptotrichia trevisanii]|uniref:transposase zinc-binding domain-containing protein n=1 Tax=Leptotrichia trevisanii TaxID=109328 RepID=UPI001563AAF3|nr:transposase zinc-binding domain-containing protein [Leptotrichia trevisanii]